MPTYTYKCKDCQEQVDVVRKISDPEVVPSCEKCNRSENMERIITASTFILKGSGWAKDGYK